MINETCNCINYYVDIRSMYNADCEEIMNLSKETTMIILEALIENYEKWPNQDLRLELLAEIMCFQKHLKTFAS